MKHIFPSIMAKDQLELDAIFDNLRGTVKYLHLDVADGKFVPNRSLWFPFKLSPKFRYIAHLMVKEPGSWIRKHGKKVEFCIVQAETVSIADHIKNMGGRKIAFALNPETSVNKIKPYLGKIDYVLILTVHPGFYGGKYLRYPLKKIKEVQKINPKIKIIVDGGMNPATAKEAVKAGADFIVSGSFITKAEQPKERMKLLDAAF
ncbi:MAG: hypothetical protein AABW53_01000 [Nanoarchaeota archaeon]